MKSILLSILSLCPGCLLAGQSIYTNSEAFRAASEACWVNGFDEYADYYGQTPIPTSYPQQAGLTIESDGFAFAYAKFGKISPPSFSRGLYFWFDGEPTAVGFQVMLETSQLATGTNIFGVSVNGEPSTLFASPRFIGICSSEPIKSVFVWRDNPWWNPDSCLYVTVDNLSVTYTAQPVLAIHGSELSWPAWASNYRLQSSADLKSWVDSTAEVQTNATTITTTIGPDTGFYRLKL